jgi:hypothetical protein
MKTNGQVLYEADAARNRCDRLWWQLTEATRALWEEDAAAVIAHDRANQPAASGVWQEMATAPRNGEDILICVPGATDHWFVVSWEADEGELDAGQWVSGDGTPAFTDETLASGHLRPMWQALTHCPTSLCSAPLGSSSEYEAWGKWAEDKAPMAAAPEAPKP